MTTTRKLDLRKFRLEEGKHSPDGKMCLLEAVAYVAGEPWSDHPECVCPVLGAFGRTWNDNLNDKDRQKLKPYVRKLIGTRSTLEVESIRSWMACDWLVRTFTPAWLRLAGLEDDAIALENLPELTAPELAKAAMPVINKAKGNAAAAWAAVRDAAWDAVWDAAWDAARAAAWDAVRDAAWDAAGPAARAAAWDAAGAAARAAAWDAVRDAVRDAAWAAVRDAAWAALQPTVIALQDSAFDLLDRMIAVTETVDA